MLRAAGMCLPIVLALSPPSRATLTKKRFSGPEGSQADPGWRLQLAQLRHPPSASIIVLCFHSAGSGGDGAEQSLGSSSRGVQTQQQTEFLYQRIPRRQGENSARGPRMESHAFVGGGPLPQGTQSYCSHTPVGSPMERSRGCRAWAAAKKTGSLPAGHRHSCPGKGGGRPAGEPGGYYQGERSPEELTPGCWLSRAVSLLGIDDRYL